MSSPTPARKKQKIDDEESTLQNKDIDKHKNNSETSEKSDETKSKETKQNENSQVTESGQSENQNGATTQSNSTLKRTLTEDEKKLRFDNTRLNDVSEGDKSFEKELIDIYKQTCDEKLPQLEEALQKEDEKNSVLYSHDIKGSSANIGAECIRRVAEKIEKLSRDFKYTEASALIPELRQEFELTYIVFGEYLQDLEQ
mmetsp:Transcript_18644/g.26129  ORF Transcript_18644/g.26129 Transcript_18644/m.26129 type:complete len:199 (+) Transcript_18644:148-744(+)